MRPFSTPYPERHGADIDGKTFDYVIVGGGTAGCVLARRLSSDPSVSVLVLEKGRVRDNLLSRIPLMSQNFMFPWLQATYRWSDPVAGIAGKRARLWTAEGLGGAARINAMLLTRGVPGGYIEWKEELGLEEWGWESVEPAFRRSETAVGREDDVWRGHDGLLESRQFPLYFKFYPYIVNAAEKLGLPFSKDINSPNALAMGYFQLDQTVDGKGQRFTAYRAFLNKAVALERKGRLSVCTGVIASKLDIDGKSGVVKGVYFRPTVKKKRGSQQDFYVRARREVIICSGALCTPQLLMLSGIGSRDELMKHDIPVIRDLPNVGATLSDHYSFPIIMELPHRDTLHMIENPLFFIWYLIIWLLFGTGILASSTTPTSIFFRTTAVDKKTMSIQRRSPSGTDNMDATKPANIPDCEIMITPFNSLTHVVPGRSLFSLYTTLVQPFSRGCVSLAGTDPAANPRVHYSILDDERDRMAMRTAIRVTMRLASEFQQSGYPDPSSLAFAPGMDLAMLDTIYDASEGGNPEQQPVPELLLHPVSASIASSDTEDTQVAKAQAELQQADWRSVTDEEIDAYAQRVGVTSLHFSCTCRISRSQADGVVDQRLRVHGMKNLRIADASVFPKLMSAHTMAPVIMVAERCAEFIQAERSERKTK